jgi:hypothetical protein
MKNTNHKANDPIPLLDRTLDQIMDLAKNDNKEELRIELYKIILSSVLALFKLELCSKDHDEQVEIIGHLLRKFSDDRLWENTELAKNKNDN